MRADDPWRPLPHRHRQGPSPAYRAHRRSGERGLTPFARALHERLRRDGPITVEAYMGACNEYYYATRDPIGVAGDFTTAPEISQMFGELVGAALADVWRRAGSPSDAIYVELGPGRGTLAADALRVMRGAGLDPALHLVETSPILRSAQTAALPGAIHHDTIGTLPPEKTILLVANEFLDALPIRQHVGPHERHVEWIGNGLAFDRDGEVIETSPVRDEAVRAIAQRLVGQGGAALVIDYGHERSAPGDTLQAVRGHRFSPVLADPGDQDLTSHVDFERVGKVAGDAGAIVSRLVEQGAWLERLGIQARARALANAAPDRAAEIEEARARLCRPDRMGSLFKVLALTAPGWPQVAGL